MSASRVKGTDSVLGCLFVGTSGVVRLGVIAVASIGFSPVVDTVCGSFIVSMSVRVDVVVG